MGDPTRETGVYEHTDKSGNPTQGLRKWQAFKTALVYYTAFDVWNVIMLLVASRFKLMPATSVEPLWNILLIQWFLGVGAIILTFIGGNAAVHFAQRNQPGGE